MTKQKGFNILRIIAILAIVFTFITTVFMIVQSLLPGDKSSKISGQLTGNRGDEIVTEGSGKIISPTSFTISVPFKYIGETSEVKVDFVPKESNDTELIYKTKKEDYYPEDVVSVDKNGIVSFNHGGCILVYAYLKSNPSVYNYVEVKCFGNKPDKISSITFQNKTVYSGTRQLMYLYDQNNEHTLVSLYDTSFLNNRTYCDIKNNLLIAKKPGKETIILTNKIDKTKQYQIEVTVLDNPNYIPIESIIINPEYVSDDNVYNVKPYSKFNFKDLVLTVPEKAKDNLFLDYSYTNPTDKTILSSHNMNIFDTYNVGKVLITANSIFDENVNISILVNCYIDEPTKIEILTADILVVDQLTTIRAFDGNYYIDDVTYKVIKGKASINGSSFRPQSLGKLVIKATYNKNPEISTTITLHIKLYKTFGQFIRKILGHLLLFSVLGFGFYCVYLFLIRKRYLALPLAIVTGFALSCLSEGLQMIAIDRYASWTDVFVDFTGFSFGMVFSLIVVLLTFLIAKIFKRYNEFKSCFDLLSCKNIFRKTSKVLENDQNR